MAFKWYFPWVDAAQRLRGVVMESLDQEQDAKGLARHAYQSRTQFYRVFRAMIEETPVAMRRRLLLERAAWQLSRTQLSVTDISLNANYGSLEAFTRAFRKAFRVSPSLYRRMGATYTHLHATNGIHHHCGKEDTKGDSHSMDPFVDALCEPPDTFTFGGMFAHVITFNSYRRMLAIDALRNIGVKVEGFGCPTEYLASLASA